MKTLPQNYQKNIEILKENLSRGMTATQANSAIAGLKKQFINAGLYNEIEQDFINEMRACVIEHFNHIGVVIA